MDRLKYHEQKEAISSMKYYIEVTQRGITTTFEKEADDLQKLLNIINHKVMGKMDYTIFSGKPYTFDNLIYSHNL
jgi:hypothetical protein